MSGIEEWAKREAKRKFPPNHLVGDPFGATGFAESDPYGYDETEGRGFESGILHLAEQLQREDVIEAAARDYYEEEANDSDGFDAWPDWVDVDDDLREVYRSRARSALDAMLAKIAEGSGS